MRPSASRSACRASPHQAVAIAVAPALPLPAPQVLNPNLLSGTVSCLVSFAANHLLRQDQLANADLSPGHLRINLPNLPKLPKVSLPKVKVPDVSLPNLPEITIPVINKKIGGPGSVVSDKDEKFATNRPRGSSIKKGTRPANVGVAGGVNVKVRVGAATRDVSVGKDAPTFAELQKARGQNVAAGDTGMMTGDGWKQFPLRRMPGANLEGFRKMAKDMKGKN